MKEVSFLRKEDKFVGLVVTIYDALSDKLNSAEFEALFSPRSYYKGFDYSNKVAKRIWKIEVKGGQVCWNFTWCLYKM